MPDQGVVDAFPRRIRDKIGEGEDEPLAKDRLFRLRPIVDPAAIDDHPVKPLLHQPLDHMGLRALGGAETIIQIKPDLLLQIVEDKNRVADPLSFELDEGELPLWPGGGVCLPANFMRNVGKAKDRLDRKSTRLNSSHVK